MSDENTTKPTNLNDDDFEKFMSTCSVAIKNKEVMKAIKKLSR